MTARMDRSGQKRTPRLSPAFLSCAFFLLSACAGNTENMYYRNWLLQRNLPLPTQDSFPNCHGNGCSKVVTLSLSPADRADLDALFTPPSRDGREERARIEQVIGLLERRTGAITGTTDDVAGTFGSFGPTQTDCVDEATNSTVYLSLIEQRGLLRFHTIRGPAVRLPILSGTGWPHTTAVITETATGKDYAVDSWFEDGGEPAHVVPLDAWKHGWKPGKPL